MKAAAVEEMPFWKYSGCGNDFILLDNRDSWFPIDNPSLINRLCDRSHGLAVDGLVLLELSKYAHFKMRIFNPDGSEAEMCGNGIRCLVKLTRRLGISGERFEVETLNGIHAIHWEGEEICVSMKTPSEQQWNVGIEIEGKKYCIHLLNTGVPHAVLFVEDIESVDVNGLGAAIRHHPYFSPAGTNVNFVEKQPQGSLSIRTFERGVEAETLACGTGATAAALALAHLFEAKSPITVQVRSGEFLKIGFHKKRSDFDAVTMTGPATFLFEGRLQVRDLFENSSHFQIFK